MDKYERVELIGEGSFGTVYKYKCGDKFFAMKFMPKCQKESDLKGTIHILRKHFYFLLIKFHFITFAPTYIGGVGSENDIFC